MSKPAASTFNDRLSVALWLLNVILVWFWVEWGRGNKELIAMGAFPFLTLLSGGVASTAKRPLLAWLALFLALIGAFASIAYWLLIWSYSGMRN